MKKMVRMLSLLLALAMVLSLAACGSSSSAPAATTGGSTGDSTTESANDNGYVVIGQTSEVANLNPMQYPRTPDSNVQNLIFSFLVKPDASLNYEPDLAESWDISDDGTVYTFHLRKDVKWHDGEPFTADDVVFTLTSLANPDYVGGNEGRVMDIVGASEVQEGTATEISGLKKVDDYTVEVTLKAPNAAFMANMYTAILPEHILSSESPADWANDSFNRAPIGTGKYKFVEWKAGQYIRLERNEDYFGEKPSIQEVTVLFGDETTLTAALLNGEIDVMYNVPTAEVQNVEAAPNVNIFTYEQMTVNYIGFNLLDDVVSDIRVRQALAHGIDKQKIVDTVFGDGMAYPCEDIFPTIHWSHTDNVTVYEYNPDLSKSLLEEAGYTMGSDGYFQKDGKRLHLVYDMSTSSTGEAIATMLQQQWKDIGVEMEVITQDFSTLAFTKLLPDSGNAETTGDSYMMYTLGFGVEVDPNEYNAYLSTSTGAGSWNFGHYSNPKIDELFNQSLLATDPAERADVYHQIAKVESDDLYWIPMYGTTGVAGVGSRVQDFTCDFRGITFQIEKWNVTD